MNRIVIKYKMEVRGRQTSEVSYKSLASEVYDGLTEIAVPANPNSDPEKEVPVYLTRKFKNVPDVKSWKVTNIELSQRKDQSVLCEITLEDVKPHLVAPSLYDINFHGGHLNQGQINRALRFGTLVECDFGYFSDTLTNTLGVERLRDYYNFKLPYEMVKKRLCVVVSNHIDPCLVIPISATADENNKSSVIELEDFPKDLYKYNNDVPHYVKGTMLTSVSSNRVFPILVKKNRRRPSFDQRFSKYISCENDIENLKKVILNTTRMSDKLKELETLKTAVHDLNEVNMSLQEQVDKLAEENQLFKEMFEKA